MTNPNQHSESHSFDAAPEAMATPPHHSNGNGKASAISHLEFQESEDLTPEEEQQLAGFNPATPHLISAEYRIKQDQEGAVERPLAERATVRLGAVVAVTGTVMGTGAVLWFGFLQPRPPVRQVTQSSSPPPTPSPTFDETAELKSRLAFQDQQHQLQPEVIDRPPLRTSPRPAAVRSMPPPVVPVSAPLSVSHPEPIIVRRAIAPPPPVRPAENVDPFQRWAQLASVGQMRVSSGAMEPSRTVSNASSDVPSGSASQENPVIPVVLIGAAQSEDVPDELPVADEIPDDFTEAAFTELPIVLTEDRTSGMISIMSRTPVDQLTQREAVREVALGTSTRARVILPMIWDEGSSRSTTGIASPSDNRFAVELTEDMRAINDRVALPKGTILVVQTRSVGRGSNLVTSSAIAIVYRDRVGQIRQQTLPPDSLQIRGEDNRPLIARKLNDVGPEIARQDLLTGLLSSLGRVGTIINQPRTQSSTVTSGGGFNQSVITTSAEPQIWAAALEGFFSPVADQMSRRSDQAVQELLQRPNVQFVPEGTKVSVVVNSFLRVER